jgi:hypothetical protein
MMLKKYWIHVLWLVAVSLYVWGGTRPDAYAEAMRESRPSYPIGGVIRFIGVTTAECLVLYWVIRPKSYHHSWKRPLAGLLLFFPWLALWALMLMHMPVYVYLHALWVFTVVLVLVGLLIHSGLHTLLRRRTH